MKDIEYLKSQINYVEGFMPEEDAYKIEMFARLKDSDFTEFGNNEKEFTVNTLNDNLPETKIMRDMITEYGQKVYNFVLDTYGGEFQPFKPEATHIARFGNGWGMHEHFDASKPNDIATLIYINSDYEGGEIYFPEYGISYKPKPGDLLTFPDNPDFIHGVKPITNGVRYTTPRWFTRIV